MLNIINTFNAIIKVSRSKLYYDKLSLNGLVIHLIWTPRSMQSYLTHQRTKCLTMDASGPVSACNPFSVLYCEQMYTWYILYGTITVMSCMQKLHNYSVTISIGGVNNYWNSSALYGHNQRKMNMMSFRIGDNGTWVKLAAHVIHANNIKIIDINCYAGVISLLHALPIDFLCQYNHVGVLTLYCMFGDCVYTAIIICKTLWQINYMLHYPNCWNVCNVMMKM